jgi:hypothetical protein
VLLLEAGRATHPWSFIPIGMARLITNRSLHRRVGCVTARR